MTESVTPLRSRVGAIDPIIKAFEAAWDTTGSVVIESFLPPADDPLYAKAVLELVRVDLELGWDSGRPRDLDDYRAAFAEVFNDAVALQAVAFEEYRQRREHGEDPDPAGYARRYGVDTSGWPPQKVAAPGSVQGTVVVDPAAGLAAASQVFRRCRQSGRDADPVDVPPAAADGLELLRDVRRSDPAAADRLADAAAALPETGEEFLGFRLEAELGRGAFGRVFLARDPDLANRQVVVKVTADLSGEEQTLAQLEHTNIVPLFARKRGRGLQAVVMPYKGGTTLADVIEGLRDSKALPASGRHLISTLHGRKLSTVKPGSSTGSAGSSPARPGEPARADSVRRDLSAVALSEAIPASLVSHFEGKSYVEAILWLGGRLADGLAHAHDRGIVHRDLKPANILLSDEGQPMLLDFNLADDARLRDRPAAARIGGTLPYMSPEQIAVFRGARDAVDARTDLYSLGLILFELLTGRAAFPNRTGPLRDSLTAMLKDRRQPPPRLRPYNPEVTPAVEAVVRKCLDPNPDQRYLSARALREDIDRHLEHLPLRHAAEPSVRERARKWARRHPRLTSATSVGVAAAVALAVSAATGLALWKEGRRLKAERARDQLAAAGNIQLGLLNPVLNSTAVPELRRTAELSRAALAAYRVPDDPNWLDGPLVRPLSPHDRDRLGNQVAGMLLVWAEAERRLAHGELADRLISLATDRLGHDSPAVVAATLGYGNRRALVEKAALLKPRTADDHFLLGRAFAREHDYKKAIPYLVEATRQDPKSFWAWNNLGGCYFDLGNVREALACYGACVGMAQDPASAYFAHYQRGMAYRSQRAYGPAQADLENAIDYLAALPDDLLRAERPKAYLLLARILADRAKGLSSRNDYAAAEKVLTDALAFDDPKKISLYLQRAEVRRLRGDPDGERQDREAVLKLEPADESDWTDRGIARSEAKDFAGAVADFDTALKLNPTYHRALQNKASVLSEDMGKPDEAMPVLDQIVDRYPDYLRARLGRGVLLARRGKRAEAHADAAAALGRDRSPMTLYQAANIYALTSKQVPADAQRVMPLLAAAVWSDDAMAEVDGDPDMKPVRDEAWFKQVVAVVRTIKAEASK